MKASVTILLFLFFSFTLFSCGSGVEEESAEVRFYTGDLVSGDVNVVPPNYYTMILFAVDRLTNELRWSEYISLRGIYPADGGSPPDYLERSMPVNSSWIFYLILWPNTDAGNPYQPVYNSVPSSAYCAVALLEVSSELNSVDFLLSKSTCLNDAKFKEIFPAKIGSTELKRAKFTKMAGVALYSARFIVGVNAGPLVSDITAISDPLIENYLERFPCVSLQSYPTTETTMILPLDHTLAPIRVIGYAGAECGLPSIGELKADPTPLQADLNFTDFIIYN
ncbi:MAG: hypothetical protein A2504_02760 [Bdellovibrionales bacterium RIFOXYD12_FULL_39_22]|nr:MAG: hypothetical protein A2385_05475 [Bdellovibrionales bacterium RIFOXYB1_FULL_39_21]OFZ42207.1 MAG: hypothetical protein A2485_15505 [Bdellovibrionales bacterium RIFOXYC12_FULL_39_17]OFZ46701.1 MAG: hypothetical protein A2404_04165 [Bdellovibrionales bacterium RIFOXYC1_FULL_39_130]OFZ76022.1 MAG: hypothetical protein A2560_02985 [Bdellovibrionales bacterium RIFOXYD1_FULL_39_84]OFZ93006.1 MAG: hypothetical protein A2504_02760 [Bdellovibrionales bacterium RIFOXYD12_FULL_39_22]HLE09895.1 hy